MTPTNAPPPTLVRLYRNLIVAAGASGMILGFAMIVAGASNMFFLFIWAFAIVVFGIALSLALLGMSAGRRIRAAFVASWIAAAFLLLPTAFSVYVLIIDRQPNRFVEDLPQMGIAEKVGLGALLGCLICLGTGVVIGVAARSHWRRTPSP